MLAVFEVDEQRVVQLLGEDDPLGRWRTRLGWRRRRASTRLRFFIVEEIETLEDAINRQIRCRGL